MKYKEVKKDLFQMDKTFCLAHCVSVDCAMGAGIAREFRRRYPQMPKAVAQMQPKIGDAIAYQTDDWLIFNLFTKQRYWHKPNYNTFTKSIQSLKEELVKRNIKKLAIPKLGAGLDRLSWDKNRGIIQQKFKDTDIEILVCHL